MINGPLFTSVFVSDKSSSVIVFILEVNIFPSTTVPSSRVNNKLSNSSETEKAGSKIGEIVMF